VDGSTCSITPATTALALVCGHDATRQWAERQRELLLPVPYFHVVLTLPAELRRPVREHQRALLGTLFRAAFDSLAALCADPRWLGGHVGAAWPGRVGGETAIAEPSAFWHGSTPHEVSSRQASSSDAKRWRIVWPQQSI
jgi:hypothetical protein